MKGLILSGRNGTTLRPLTHTGPKQLIPIANKPIILYCVEDLRDAGITDIGVVLSTNMPDMVRELLGYGSEFGVKITYIEQGAPQCIAHAVGCAEQFIHYMADEFLDCEAEALVALAPVDDPTKFGIVELNEKGEIVDLVKKPTPPKGNLSFPTPA
jgi:glucose-1-phosphate thymidylyltransferase